MKTKLFILLLFLFCSIFSFGQKNIIKGHALILPKNNFQWLNIGVGYEYMVLPNLTAQLFFEHRRKNTSDTLFNFISTNETLLEMRYNHMPDQILNKAFFATIFLSAQVESFVPTDEYESNFIFIKNRSTNIGVGVGLGKNVRLNDRWHIELLGGFGFFIQYKTNKVLSSTTIATSNTTAISNTLKSRLAINLAYSF